MKVTKDDLKLIRACCILKEIDLKLKGKYSISEYFEKLQNVLKELDKNSKYISLNRIRKNCDFKSYSVNTFLDEIGSSRRNAFVKKYKEFGKKVASNYNLFGSIHEDIDVQLDKLFKESQETLTLAKVKEPKKFIGKSIIGLLASGALVSALYISNSPSKDEPTSTPAPIETTIPEPNINSQDTTINQNDKVNKLERIEYTQKDVIDNFKELYIHEYNSENSTSLTTADIKIIDKKSNYIYQINIDNEYKYVSHGEQPQMIEKYLKQNNIPYQTIDDYYSLTVYKTKYDGNIQRSYDFFGNFTPTILDSSVILPNEEGSYSIIKLYDGNNPEELLNEKAQKKPILSKMGKVVYEFHKVSNDDVENYTDYFNSVKYYTEKNTQNNSIKENDDYEK